MNWVAVALGGALGSCLRYAFGRWFIFSGVGLPIATLLSNLLACAAMSVVLFSTRQLPDALLRSFLLVGFCGGLSTFSTFGYETMMLLKTGQVAWAIANIGISIALSLSLLAIGMGRS